MIGVSEYAKAKYRRRNPNPSLLSNEVTARRMDTPFTYGTDHDRYGRPGEWLITTGLGIEYALDDETFRSVYVRIDDPGSED